jgi:murein DD-endopeptidase MepM/ murein hydrolase activator NlpD
MTTQLLNLEEEITRLETELRLYKELKLTRIERRINELLDQLDNPATPQTKGQRLRERLGIVAATVALTALSQGHPEIPLIFQQPTNHEQVSPKFSSSSDQDLGKAESRKAPSLAKPEAKEEQISLLKLMKAIASQESGGRSDLINQDSGASGKWQVMPANIPAWSREALGREVTHEEFIHSPEIQQQVVKHRLGLYLNQESTLGRSEEEIVRRVASLWYSGQARLWDSTKPQYSNGRRYPSIAEYTESVWNLYQDAKTPKYSSTKALISTWSEKFQQDPELGQTIAGFEVTSLKGWRTHPITGVRTMHQGVDVAMPVGTPLYAIADGTVEYGRNEIAGLYASFTSDKFPGLAFKLVHLSQGLAEPGTKREVKQGEVIGWSGGEKGNPNSGRSTGPHLHLGIKGESGNWLRVRSGWLHWFITGKEPR